MVSGTIGNRRHLAWGALLLLSLGLHLWRLGGRSFHHDEAIHAAGSYDLATRGIYRYDPTYHGPLLYVLTAGSFVLLGDSDFTARLPVALAGVLLLGVAWRLRREVGERAAWWTGLLATISPTVLYYGRFLRMDVIELAAASAALAVWLEVLRGSARAWPWLGLWGGLALAAKENVYVTAALLCLSALVLAVPGGVRRRSGEAVAWVSAHRWGIAAAACVATAVTLTLYTVLFRHPGDWAFPVKAVRYWWGQHAAQRVSGPWWYHLPRLALYEFLPLAAGTALVFRRRRPRRPLESFLFVFGVLSIAMYAYLGEKTPWLEVHQVWPFLLLGGIQLAEVFGPEGRRWARAVAGAGIALTAASALAAIFLTEEISPALGRAEALHYVQTCPELHRVVEEGVALASSGERPVAAVQGEAGWPLTWYWRHIDVWWEAPSPGTAPPLVLCDPDAAPAIRRRLGPRYRSQRVPLRAWWVADRAPGPVELVRYLVTRRPWTPIGASEVVLLRRTGESGSTVRDAPIPGALAAALGITRALVIGEGVLAEPRGIAVSEELVAVADSGLGAVVLFDRAGELVDRPFPEPLREPEGVAWAPGGVLAVADTWNHRVLLWAASGGKVRPLPAPDGGWYGPRAVAVAESGTLAVADTGNQRLVVSEPGARRQWTIGRGGAGPGELAEPVGVAWVGGRLLVCDSGNRRLQVLDAGGRMVREVGLPGAWTEPYSRPKVAVLAPDLWVATDPPGRRLWIVRDGRVGAVDLAPAGITPMGIAWQPPDLYLGDGAGRIWRLERPATGH